MFQTPRRIAVLIPASDPIVENDFHLFLPKGISFHTGRLPQAAQAKTAAFESLNSMTDNAPAVAKTMVQVDPELILFCCTAASFYKGVGWDNTLAKSITDATGIPATVTSGCVARALNAVGARTAFMVTPYRDEINKIEREFFKGNGVEIKSHTTFDCPNSRDIDKKTPDEIISRVRENKKEIAACDAIFISCTALRSMETIESLEAEYNKPVITSNASSIWDMLQRLGIDSSGVKAGRLFKVKAGPKARAAE
ncbi:MAG: hypothetical protein EXQ86_03910 [Rhodospirillales bacterium]|nr:hypothetical protein [Rhodospirillales bacterium]